MEGASVIETHTEAVLETTENLPNKGPVWVVLEALYPSLPKCQQGSAEPLQLRVVQGHLTMVCLIEPEEVLSVAVHTCTYDGQMVCYGVITSHHAHPRPQKVMQHTTPCLCNPSGMPGSLALNNIDGELAALS